ncbi:hypothetical protein [Desertivirga arenae]|uniref:hypothetical protein n=1 Tax=Desertivirga arenae TaxID=2810309 RepID=UPI001A959DCF|nr:hypothetical protein [Pedobacter sp. SYSU D00823]
MNNNLNAFAAITLDELAKKHNLTFGTTTNCRKQLLTSLGKIMDYCKENRHGWWGKGWSRISEKELRSLYREYRDEIEMNTLKTPWEIYESLNVYKKVLFNRFFRDSFYNLGTRTKKSLLLQCKTNEVSERDIVAYLLALGAPLKKTKTIKGKSSLEAEEFRTKIETFLQSIRDKTFIDREDKHYKLAIQSLNKLIDNCSIDLSQFFTSDNKFKLFAFLNFILSAKIIFNPRRTAILSSLYNAVEPASLSRAIKEVGLSQSVRTEIYDTMYTSFRKLGMFLRDIPLIDFNNYPLDVNSRMIEVTKAFATEVNAKEEVHFNPFFYAHILQLVLEDYFLIEMRTATGDRVNILKRSCHGTFYLVRWNIYHTFNFQDFTTDIQLACTNKMSHEVCFDKYLLKFLEKDVDTKELSEIKEICEKILLQEFNLRVNDSGYLKC